MGCGVAETVAVATTLSGIAESPPHKLSLSTSILSTPLNSLSTPLSTSFSIQPALPRFVNPDFVNPLVNPLSTPLSTSLSTQPARPILSTPILSTPLFVNPTRAVSSSCRRRVVVVEFRLRKTNGSSVLMVHAESCIAELEVSRSGEVREVREVRGGPRGRGRSERSQEVGSRSGKVVGRSERSGSGGGPGRSGRFGRSEEVREVRGGPGCPGSGGLECPQSRTPTSAGFCASCAAMSVELSAELTLDSFPDPNFTLFSPAPRFKKWHWAHVTNSTARAQLRYFTGPLAHSRQVSTSSTQHHSLSTSAG